jgi:uncharacterized protein (TIGR02145 family)
MKKLILAFALTSALFSCNKDTTTPNNSGSNTIQNPKSGFGPNITDSDGNSYKTVYIGSQTWMAENLKTSKYNDGTSIPNVKDSLEWLKLTTGAWCYYDNDNKYNAKYGKLYNWYAVDSISNGNKNVCPTGWHVPSDAEWKVLTDYLGGDSIGGGKMKEVGITSWYSPNTLATNTSLFTGLPGGYRKGNCNYCGDHSYEGVCVFIGVRSYWWSSSELSGGNSWFRTLRSDEGDVYRGGLEFKSGLSVRCLRD